METKKWMKLLDPKSVAIIEDSITFNHRLGAALIPNTQTDLVEQLTIILNAVEDYGIEIPEIVAALSQNPNL